MGSVTYNTATLLQHDTVCIESMRSRASLFDWLWGKDVSHRLTDAMLEPLGSGEPAKEHPSSATTNLVHIFDEPRGKQPLLEVSAHPDEVDRLPPPWLGRFRGALTRNTLFQVWDYKPRRLVGGLHLTRSWLTGIPAMSITDQHDKPLGEITRATTRMLMSWWTNRPLQVVMDQMLVARMEETVGGTGYTGMRVDFARSAANLTQRKLCLAAAILLHRNQLVRIRGYT